MRIEKCISHIKYTCFYTYILQIKYINYIYIIIYIILYYMIVIFNNCKESLHLHEMRSTVTATVVTWFSCLEFKEDKKYWDSVLFGYQNIELFVHTKRCDKEYEGYIKNKL